LKPRYLAQYSVNQRENDRMKSMIPALALCVGLLPAGAWAQTQELKALV
jgi:hypothetical protein